MTAKVRVRATCDGDDFLQYAGDWLNRNEADNNTILSIAGDAGSDGSMLRPPFWFGLAECSRGFGGVAAFALPDGLVLSDMADRYVPPLVNALLSEGLMPARIYAPPGLAEIASCQLRESIGKTFKQQRVWLAYVISEHVAPPPLELGTLQPATQSDLELVRQLGSDYGFEKPSIVDVSRYFVSKLRTGDLYLWVDTDTDEVKTVIAISGSTDNVIRIAGVFTPRSHRCKGYGSAAVSTVTNAQLDAGYQSVTLMADKDDANALHLYESLGYERLHVRVELVVDNDTNP